MHRLSKIEDTEMGEAMEIGLVAEDLGGDAECHDGGYDAHALA